MAESLRPEGEGFELRKVSDSELAASRFENEVLQPMLADRELFATDQMSFDDLWDTWGSQFESRRDFCSFLGITDPVYEGSIQQEIERNNMGGLKERYGFEDPTARLPEGSILVEKGKSVSRIRIATTLLPMEELGMGHVTAEYIDVSFALFDKLKSSNPELLRKVVDALLVWAAFAGKHIQGDGKLVEVSPYKGQLTQINVQTKITLKQSYNIDFSLLF